MRKEISTLATALCLATLLARQAVAAGSEIRLDFSDPAAWEQVQANGDASPVLVNDRMRLRLTQDLGEAASVWLQRPLLLPGYTAEFDFAVTRTEPADEPADGFAFAAQEYGPGALGDNGGGLAYTSIPGYSYAVEFNTYAPQGLPEHPETVAVDIIGTRAKVGQVAFPHIDRGIFHAAIAVRRDGIEVPLSAGSDHLPPTRLITTPWWLQFVTDQPLWIGFTGATGGLRSTIDILNLTITPRQ